jgi:hypothetical protein
MSLSIQSHTGLSIKKKTLADALFFLVILLVISPWFFERRLLFNEILSAAGFLILAYKKFRISNDAVSRYVVLLLGWGLVHMVVSLARMDSLYYYLRNVVIIYSVFAYFAGYFLFRYVEPFLNRFGSILHAYILFFLLIPVSTYLFERFGMATLFPAMFNKTRINRVVFPLLIVMDIIYSFTYSSATLLIITAFYLLLWISPGYRFFKQVILIFLVAFTAFFISVQPNLSLIAERFSPYNDFGIIDVRNSHPLLFIDPNSTWRLIMWKEVIVDHFPANIFGLGFGTPVMIYFPVEDYSKVDILPYVLGAHNSFIYLFGRLGIVYVILTVLLYRGIIKEYFSFQSYHTANKTILFFWSFFAISIIAVFNPVLESPIFAGVYWLVLGLLSRAILKRKREYGAVPDVRREPSTVPNDSLHN